jgi:antitoxin (DNA-binding transcriptional repressor) of toxin-antitoxin stability system
MAALLQLFCFRILRLRFSCNSLYFNETVVSNRIVMKSSGVHYITENGMNITVKTLPKRLPDVLAALKKNERVVLSSDGEEVALLQPIPEPDKELKRFMESPLFGMWGDREELSDPSEWVRSIRKPRISVVSGGAGAR